MTGRWLLAAVVAATVLAQDDDEVFNMARNPALLMGPVPTNGCFAKHPYSASKEKALLNRDCLLSFLFAIERQLLHAIPVIQGQNDAEVTRRTDMVHSITHTLRVSVSAFPPDSTLEATYVQETLFALDILGEGQPGTTAGGKMYAMGVLYDDYLETGGKVDGTKMQLSYDHDNWAMSGGTPSFETGDPAPLINEITQVWSKDHDGTFASLVNPDNCKPGDQRAECLTRMPELDPRYALQPMWVNRLKPEYHSQPLDEALRSFNAKQDAIRLRMRSVDPNVTNSSFTVPNRTHSSLQNFIAVAPTTLSSPVDPTSTGSESYCNVKDKKVYQQRPAERVRVGTDTLLQTEQSYVTPLTTKSLEVQYGAHVDRDLVVAFHASWCPQSEALSVALEGFAQRLNIDSAKVEVASIDVGGANADVIQRFHISQLPLIAYMPKGDPIHVQAIHTYTGRRTPEDLAVWFKQRQEVANTKHSPVLVPNKNSAPEPEPSLARDATSNTESDVESDPVQMMQAHGADTAETTQAQAPKGHNFMFGYTPGAGDVLVKASGETHEGIRVGE